MINDIEFWQLSSSQRETFVFKDWHIQETNIWALFVSDNTIFARLNYWNETLQAFNIMQVMNMMTKTVVKLKLSWEESTQFNSEFKLRLNWLSLTWVQFEIKLNCLNSISKNSILTHMHRVFMQTEFKPDF